MLIIGLTGNIGTGKSTVLRYLASKGALVLDADKLAHQAIQPGMPAYQLVIDAFGTEIVQSDGAIDRAALGKIVFTDPARLVQLETIVHPVVFALARELLAQSTANAAILEAIKLLESQRLVTLCAEIWVVVASPETQVQRLTAQRGISEAEARRRMAAQSSTTEKIEQAIKLVRKTRVIHNDGAPEELYAQLDAIWAEIDAQIAS